MLFRSLDETSRWAAFAMITDNQRRMVHRVTDNHLAQRKMVISTCTTTEPPTGSCLRAVDSELHGVNPRGRLARKGCSDGRSAALRAEKGPLPGA
jgi:hypothetical protein